MVVIDPLPARPIGDRAAATITASGIVGVSSSSGTTWIVLPGNRRRGARAVDVAPEADSPELSVAHGMLRGMVRWKDVEDAEPEFAARVRRIFDAGENKVIATLRADGSPRVSGIEAEFVDGELTFGSMPGARKGADLARDPRFAMHGPAPDPPEDKTRWIGDAKISGRVVRVEPPDGPAESDQYRADIAEVVVTRLNEAVTMLVIEVWRPDGGLRRVERA
jgi:hypothetical protein